MTSAAAAAAKSAEARLAEQRARLQPTCIVARPLMTAAVKHTPEQALRQYLLPGCASPEQVLQYAGTQNVEKLLCAAPASHVQRAVQSPLDMAKSTIEAVRLQLLPHWRILRPQNCDQCHILVDA